VAFQELPIRALVAGLGRGDEVALVAHCLKNSELRDTSIHRRASIGSRRRSWLRSADLLGSLAGLGERALGCGERV
jgi:hypothetical protein